jgi:predicted phage tail protein
VDVSQNGARVASIPMGLTSTWSYNEVPAGTFAFTVRATNAVGTSGSSNSVTLTFPLSSCSSPGGPRSLTFGATGRSVAAHWLPPTSGTAPTRYTVEARLRNPNNSTTALGSFPVSATTISSPVGPGRYEVRVRSENICGNSGYTGWQSVTVQ